MKNVNVMSKGLYVRLRKQYRNCMYSVSTSDTMEIKTRKCNKILTVIVSGWSEN